MVESKGPYSARARLWLAAAALGLLVLLPLKAVHAQGLGDWLTSPGQAAGELLASSLSDATGYRVKIGSVKLQGVSTVTLVDVTLADDEGIWARAPKIGIQWKPRALLDKKIQFESLLIPDLTVLRSPQGGQTEGQADDGGGLALDWPRPGVDMVLKDLQVTVRTPDDPKPVTIKGAFTFLPGVLRATLKTAGGDDVINADIDISEEQNSIGVRLDVKTSPKGSLARLLGLGAIGPDFRLEGAGSPAEWAGGLIVDLPEGDHMDVRLKRAPESAGGDQLGFVLLGTARLTAGGLTHADIPEDLGTGLAGAYDVDGSVVFNAGAVQDLSLRLESARVKALLDHKPAETPDLLALDLTLLDPAVLSAVLGDFSYSSARMAGTFNLAGPTRFDGQLGFSDMKSGDITAIEIGGDVQANFADLSTGVSRIALTGAGTGRGFSAPGAGQPVIVDGLTWELSGYWPDGGTVITIDRFKVTAPALAADGRATITTASGDFEASGTLAAPDISLFRPELKAGRYEGNFVLADTRQGFHIGLEGGLADVQTAYEGLNPLVAAGDFTLDFRQPRALAAGHLQTMIGTEALNITADARFNPDDTMDATLTTTVRDMRAARAVLGVELAEDSRLEARLNGPMTSPDLRLQARVPRIGGGLGLEDVTLNAAVRDIGQRPNGDLRLAAIAPMGQVNGRVRIESPSPDEIALSEVVLNTPLADLGGALTLARTSGVVTGRIAGQSGDVELIRQTFDVEGAGSFSLDIVFANAAGKQALTFEVAGQEVSTILSDRQAISVDALELTGNAVLKGGIGTVADPESLSMTSRMSKLRAGALTLDEVLFRAEGTGGVFPYDLTATGDFFGVVDLASRGRLDMGDAGLTLTVDSFGGRLSERDLKLVEPVTYVGRAGYRDLSPMRLTYGDGEIFALYRADQDGQLLRLEVEETDAGLVPLFLPIPPITGALDVRLLLEVKDNAASGYAALAARNIRPRGGEDENFPLEAGLSIELDDNLVMVSGRADSPALKADFYADIPAEVNPDRARVRLDGDRELSAHAKWDGGLTPLVSLLPPLEHSFGGRLAGALDIGGTIDDPSLAGRFELSDGVYENFAFGARLMDLAGLVTFDGQEVRLNRLEGRDLNGGRLTGEGAFTLDPDRAYPGRLTLTLDDLKPVNLDAATGTASGTLAYIRRPEEFVLEGNLEAKRMELRLADKLPVEVTTLDVIEVNGKVDKEGKDPVPETSGDSANEAELRPILEALDVQVSAPARLYVRGRGLDSEWQGDLQVIGSPEVPRVLGNLGLVRGSFAFAGRQIDLTEGRLQFTGAEKIDPHIELTGIYDTVSLTAEIRLSGPISAPSITLSSTPAMPEDEIMARILFGTSVHELSAVEAVQLAAAVSSLSGGGGFDVFSKARSVLGLDRLTIEDGEEETGGRLVTGGKYLSNNIYLEVQTQTDTGESNATVRVDLTRHLQVESDVGSDNSSSIGVRWKKDY
jgi:autotransporter translocation and assembly factor TamB